MMGMGMGAVPFSPDLGVQSMSAKELHFHHLEMQQGSD
jgi:hypothetical protein